MPSTRFSSEFEDLFRKWSAWYRLRRTTAWLLKGLIFGLALALGFSLVGIYQEGLLKDEFLPLVVRFALVSTLVAALAGWIWPVSREQLARFFDQHYALQERSSTALELLDRETNLPAGLGDSILYEKQLIDTLEAGNRVHPRVNFFFRANRLQGFLIVSLVLGLVLTVFFGEPFFKNALQQRQNQQAIAQEAARLEALAEQIRNNEQISPAQSEQLAQTLEEAVKKLNEAQTPEQAVAVLSSTENQLRALESSQAQDQAESLENAGKRLSEDNPPGSDTPLESFTQNLSEGDYLAAAQDLANLDLSQLSAEEASSLANQLEEASKALADANPELAQQLAEAAQALKDGDFQAAQQALQQAAQTLANTSQQIAQSQAAQQAAEQVSQGQGRLIQSGESQEGQAQAGQPGTGQGNQGTNNTQGNSGESSSPSSSSGGSGAGAGESAGQEGEGPEAGTSPIEQDNQVGNGGIGTYEEIFAPQRLGGSGGEEVALTGNGEEGDQVVGQGDTAPGDANDSHVPYVEVFSDYAEAYRQAVDSGQVPVGLRALVKKYFSSLEP